MSSELFVAVIVASRTGDWSRVYELIGEGHLSYAETRRIVKGLR